MKKLSGFWKKRVNDGWKRGGKEGKNMSHASFIVDDIKAVYSSQITTSK